MMKKINDISGKNPFKVPDNYFEEVKKKIISATLIRKAETGKVNLLAGIRPFLAVAASIALFVIIGYTAVRLIRSNNNSYKIPEISMQEYSETYLDDIDIATLEEEAAQSVFSDENPDLTKTEIIDYLILENIDLNEIYEFL